MNTKKQQKVETHCQISPNTRSITCNGCDLPMTTNKPNKQYCSQECKVRHKSILRYTGVEEVDYLVCPICKIRTRQFTPDHAKMHGYSSIKEMAHHLNILQVTCQKKKYMSAGENNPAYQHNGKYSPWSKNFVHGYNEERHMAAKANHSRWVNEHLIQNQFNIAYWLAQTNGNKEEASKLFKKSQTRSLEWFVEKYGEIDGKKRYLAKTEKWIKTMNSKSSDELAIINSKKMSVTGKTQSRAEKELFEVLNKHIPMLTKQKSIYRDNDIYKKLFYIYDICFENKIIEFNGDFWHANPKIYDSLFVNPYSKKTQHEIMLKDADKQQTAIENGYAVLTIWENEYHANKQETINKCLHFLNK